MRAPWHLWAVGFASLLWNAMGAADYTLTQIRYAPYLSQFTPEQLAWFESFPAWVQGTWALAVWLSVAGSLLLLLRSRHAAPCLGLSLIFLILTFVHNFYLADISMIEISGTWAAVFSAAIALVAALLWLYGRWMRARGVLG